MAEVNDGGYRTFVLLSARMARASAAHLGSGDPLFPTSRRLVVRFLAAVVSRVAEMVRALDAIHRTGGARRPAARLAPRVHSPDGDPGASSAALSPLWPVTHSGA
jgi:hypothetical protein